MIIRTFLSFILRNDCRAAKFLASKSSINSCSVTWGASVSSSPVALFLDSNLSCWRDSTSSVVAPLLCVMVVGSVVSVDAVSGEGSVRYADFRFDVVDIDFVAIDLLVSMLLVLRIWGLALLVLLVVAECVLF